MANGRFRAANAGGGPLVAVGMPVYNEADHLEEALESLRTQTLTDFAVVVVDNCSTDASPEIAWRFAEADQRFSWVRRADHVGILDSFRGAYRHALAAHPGASYFLWAGGHDVLEPDFLAVLVAELDGAPSVVGAWPSGLHSRGGTEWGEDPLHHPDTVAVEGVRDRFRAGVPGAALHGLLRPEPLARAGVCRRVLLADRLLMAELSLYGDLKHVPRRLWRRRLRAERTRATIRQRSSVFTGGAPVYAYLPWQVQHAGALLVAVSLKGSGLPAIGRAQGPRVAWEYLKAVPWLDHPTRKRLRQAEVRLPLPVRRLERKGRRRLRKATIRLTRRLRGLARKGARRAIKKPLRRTAKRFRQRGHRIARPIRRVVFRVAPRARLGSLAALARPRRPG